MKLDQLIEYKIWNIFHEKSYTKCDGETIPRSFSKKSKSSKVQNSVKFYIVCFYCMLSWGLLKYIETKLPTTCFFLIWNVFKKQ